MPNGRLEAQITVPTGGWSGTIDDSGGGGAVSWSVPAGIYYLVELLVELASRLNIAAPTDTITVTVGNGENGTGRVTISSTGTIAIVWIAIDLRDLLGYTGNLSGSSSYLATQHARSLWIAGSPYRAPNEVAPWAGWPKADFRTVESAAGQVWAFMGQKKEIASLAWDAVPRSRASKANEVLVNESFQRFVEDGVWGVAPWGTPAGPVRFFPDAGVASYAEYYVTDLNEFVPEQFADGWAGGPWKVQLPRLVVKGIVTAGAPPATPQRQFPASSSAWTTAFASVTTPSRIWTFQEIADPIDEKIGTADLVENQPLLYAQAGDTEPTLAPRSSLEFDTTATAEFNAPSSTTVGDIPAGTNFSLWLRVRVPDNAATARQFVSKSTGAGARWIVNAVATSGAFVFSANDGTNPTRSATTVGDYADGLYHDVLVTVARSGGNAVVTIIVDTEVVASSSAALLAVEPAVALHFGGGQITVLAGTRVSYAALWASTAISSSEFTTLRTAI
jgi:hypothetical protein